MKKLFSKTNLILLLLFLTPFMYRCKNAEVSIDENSLEGAYNVIVNPVLCAAPSILDVKIKSSGTSYTMTFTNRITAANEELSSITVEKTENTSKLFYKSMEIGKFTSMKYTDSANGAMENREGMVLMVNFNSDSKHYEFMGRK
jgi:hypothetical protein